MIDRQSFLISGGIHLFCIVLFLIGLPNLRKEIVPTRVIAVSMVPIDKITQSPQRVQKKVPVLSSYKKPTYKMGKPLAQKKEPVSKPLPVPKNVQAKVSKIAPLKADSMVSKKPQKTIEQTPLPPQVIPQEKTSKKSKDSFDSVLQSVQEFEQKALPDHTTTDERAFEADLISSKISLSELDALRQQLQQCWLVPPTVMAEKDLVVEAAVDLDVRGMVTEIKILNQKDAQRFRSFREAVQSVRQALRAPECSPLKLPSDKYHQWKKCVLRFSPRGIG
jgi:hypothetical protein